MSRRKRGLKRKHDAEAEDENEVQQLPKTKPNKKQKKNNKFNGATKFATLPIFQDTSPFVDVPKGAESQREFGLYEYLASEDSDERIAAANVIISALLGGEGVPESVLRRHLERRLIRGLASGRKAARPGFSLALTEILSQLLGRANLAGSRYPGLNFEGVFSTLIAMTRPEGGVGGQEEKDHALGLLFGLQCFVRAEVVAQEERRWRAVLEKLLELEKKKPWIREECGWVLVEALQQLSQTQVEYTLGQIQDAGLGLSPEGVGIWITARSKFPKMKFPNKPWGQNGDPLEHLKSLAQALKESSSNEQDGEEEPRAKQTGSWNPQLHFVWDIVLGQYSKVLQGEGEGENNKVDFPTFWKVVVDENLFSANASNERKAWGLALFRKVLQDCSIYGNALSAIFSPNLMRCLSNHTQVQSRTLYLAASGSLGVLIEAAQSSKPIHVPIFISQLLEKYDVSPLNKSKIIEKLLDLSITYGQRPDCVYEDEYLADGTISALTYAVKKLGGLDERTVEIRRQEYSHYLVYLTKKVKISDCTEGTVSNKAIHALFATGYSKVSDWTPPISMKTRAHFRDRMTSALSNSLIDLESYQIPCQLLLGEQASIDAVDMDDALRSEYDRALSVLQKLQRSIRKRQKAGEDSILNPLRALALLFGLISFQLMNGEPDAVAFLEDLHLCYDSLIQQKKDSEITTQASEVLVELLLSLGSKPSALFRRVNQLVFAAFTSEINAQGLKLLTDVLTTRENLKGRRDLFNEELIDEDILMNDGETSDEDLDSDVEIIVDSLAEKHIDGDEHSSNEEESGSDDENEEYSADELENGDDEKARQLDQALAEALGTRRADEEKMQDSDSDEDMTDSEMLALDTKLVEIFKQTNKPVKRKDELKDAKETVINFKRRVLDLLEIYLKKQAGTSIAFNILLPLLQLMRTSQERTLTQRAAELVSTFVKAAKSASTDIRVIADVDSFTSEKLQLLEAIHEEAAKSISNLSKKSASMASMLVSSTIYRADKDCIENIAKIYHKTEIKWLKGEINMAPLFFVDWVNWCQSHALLAGGGRPQIINGC